MPPQRSDKNKLVVKKGQIQAIRAKIIDRSAGFGFGSIGISWLNCLIIDQATIQV